MTILVHNLIDNAVKYSGNDVKIEVGTRQVENKIRLWVMDHGCGISKIDQKYFPAILQVGKIKKLKGNRLRTFPCAKDCRIAWRKDTGRERAGERKHIYTDITGKKEV